MLVARADPVLVDALRQADGPSERPETALVAVEAVVGRLLGLLALGGDGQRVVLDLDRDRVLGDAGKVERVDDVRLGLPIDLLTQPL